MADDRSVTIKFTGDPAGLQSATQTASQGLGKLGADTEKLQAGFKAYNEAIQAIAASTGLTYKQTQELTKGLKLSNDQLPQVAQRLKQLEAEGTTVAQRLQTVTREFGGLGKAAQEAQQKLNIPQGGLGGPIQGANTLKLGIGGVALGFNALLTTVNTFTSAASGLFDSTVGAVDRFNQRLLSAQTTLAATTQISRGGQTLQGVEAIQASAQAYRQVIGELKKDTENLSGLTAGEVNQLFSSINSKVALLVDQSKTIQNPLEAVRKITQGIAATAATAQIPIEEANTQIKQILSGTFSQTENKLAGILSINQEQVRNWAAQGILVDELAKRTQQFVEGNKLGADSIKNLQSNFETLFASIQSNIGKPLFEPVVRSLNELFEFFKSNQDNINNTTTEFINGLISILGPVFQQLRLAAQDLQKQFSEAFGGVNAKDIREFGNLIGPFLRGALLFTVNALTLLDKALIQFAKNATILIGPIIERYGQGLSAALKVATFAYEKINATLVKLGLVANQTGGQLGDSLDKAKLAGEGLADALSGAGDITISKKPLEDLGSIADQTSKKITNGFAAINNAGQGEVEKAKTGAQEVIAAVQQGLEQGNVSTEEAIANLRQLAENSKLPAETRIAAEQAITKVIQDGAQQRVTALDGEIKRVQSLVTSQQLSESEGDRQVTALKIEQLQLRLEAQRKIVEQQGEGSKAGQAAIAQEKSLQAEIATLRADFNQRQEQREIKRIQDAAAKALDVAKEAEIQQQIAIAQLENEGTLSKGEIETRKLEATKDRLNAELVATQQQLAALSKLPTPNDPQKAAERETQLRQLRIKTGEITLQVVQNQGKIEEAIQQAAIRRIKQRAAEEQVATERQVRSLQLATAGQDALTKSIERQQKLTQATQGLEKALGDARQSASERELANFDRAAELRKKLDAATDPDQKKILQQELNRLGQTGQETELDLLQKRQALENRIAQVKLENLQAEQARARQNLELEIQRNAIAARRQEIEAKIAEVQAKGQVAAALAAQAEAKKITDPEERKAAELAAQNQLEAAKQGEGLATEARKASEQQTQDQVTIADRQRQELAAKQADESAAANTAESARVVDASLTLAEAKASGLAGQLNAAADASQRIKDNLGGLGGSIPVTPITPRLKGGPASPGNLYLGGEQQPELAVFPSGKTAVIGGDGPELFTVSQPAMILPSIPTVQAQVIHQERSPASSPVESVLLEQIRGLRSDLAQAEFNQSNQFTFVNEPRPEQKAIGMTLGLQQAKANRMGV